MSEACARCEVLRAEREARRVSGTHCPDCDDRCEPWAEDGVSCGYKVREPRCAKCTEAAFWSNHIDPEDAERQGREFGETLEMLTRPGGLAIWAAGIKVAKRDKPDA